MLSRLVGTGMVVRQGCMRHRAAASAMMGTVRASAPGLGRGPAAFQGSQHVLSGCTSNLRLGKKSEAK